jgi:hypothetical protein
MLLLFTLLTLTSALPMNQLIDNENKVISSFLDDLNSKNLPIKSSKVTSIINPKSAYSYNEAFSVKDVVDEAFYYKSLGDSGWDTINWFVPLQPVEVYIGKNPCLTREAGTNKCQAESTPGHTITDFRLVSTGTASTLGTDATKDGIDDTWGVIDNTSFNGNFTQAKEDLSYEFSVSIPSKTNMDLLGLTGGSVTIYEFFPGNTLPKLNGWVIKNTTVLISSDENFHLDASSPNYAISAETNTTYIDFHAFIFTNDTADIQIDYNITDSNSNVCGTSEGNCAGMGFTIIESNNNVTDSLGIINFTISFLSLGSIPEGTYTFSAIARIVNPTNSFAISYAGDPWYLTQDKMTSVSLVVNYGLQTPVVSKVNVPGFGYEMYPFVNNPSLPSIRPGDYFEGNTHQSVNGGLTNVEGAPIKLQLYERNTQLNYTSELVGGFANVSFPGGPFSDASGNLQFRVDLTYLTPQTTFDLVVYGDYNGMTNKTPYWIKDSEILLGNYSFTVDNQFDSGSISYVKAYPSSNVTLTSSPTSLTLEFQATAILNSSYVSYAQYYSPSVLPTSPYPLAGLPVNATIQGGPITGITLSVDSAFNKYNDSFYYTDANGYINFTLKTKYPDIFQLKTFKLDIIANYTPMIESNLSAYRFTRNSGLITNTSTTQSQSVTFNPRYTIIGLEYLGNNLTSNTTLRQGDTGLLVFRTINSSSLVPIGGVQFNFSIILGQTNPGLNVYTTNLNDTNYPVYNLSGPDGRIFIYFNSTYGITPETVISITIKVYLNVTLFNLTNIDNNFYIGEQHKGTGTYQDYEITYTENTASFSINPSYIVGKPVWVDPITDTQILNPLAGINTVRPNNETIQIRLKVVYVSSPTQNILNYRFPVNASLITSYQGISLTIASALFEANGTGWYFTNDLGYIDFNISINYLPGYSKTDTIKLNATVNFGNDKCVTGCQTELVKWIVGQTSVSGFNLSQQSTSTFTNSANFLTITKDPAYVTGSVGIQTVSPFKIVPNTNVTLTYKAYISKSDTYATKDALTANGVNDVPLQGVKIYLDENVLFAYNMSVALNGITTDSQGLAAFIVNVTKDTPDGFYQIPAYVDYENDNNLIVSIANKTKTFNYYWLNGSISTLIAINGSYSIQNYSKTNSTDIEVKRSRLTTVTINRAFDKNNNFVPLGPDNEVLRGYKLELTIDYKDQDNNKYSVPLDLKIQTYNQLNQFVNITLTNFATTNVSGLVVSNLTIQNNYYIGDAGIIAVDSAFTGPFAFAQANFTIKTKLQFSGVTYQLPFSNSVNEAFVGENITVTGTLTDELGPINTSFYNLNILNELINSLNMTGLDKFNALIVGSDIYKSLTFSATSATFIYTWQVPTGYLDSELKIRVSIIQTGLLIHFVDGSTNIPATLPEDTSVAIPVYQSVSYVFTVSNSDGINANYYGKTINLTSDYTGSVSISGQFYDNYGRLLFNRGIYLRYNVTSDVLVNVDGTGNFAFTNYISSLNENVTYELFISYNAPNNTIINIWSNFIQRIVFDKYAPNINSWNSDINNTYILNDIILNLTISDPSSVNGQYVASTNILNTSATLTMNDTLIWNNTDGNYWNGSNPLYIQWNISSVDSSISFVVLKFTVSDNANNANSTTIFLKIDKIQPVFLTTSPISNVYVYQSNFVFSFTANDTQTAIDNSTALVDIDGIDYLMSYNPNTNEFSLGNFDFSNSLLNRNVYFSISDIAGNRANSTSITLLADLIKPSVILSNPSSNDFDVITQTVPFTFSISDSETGIDQNSIKLFDINNTEVVGIQLDITDIGGTYSVSGVITKNQMNLFASNQIFYVNATDLNGNKEGNSLRFKIDIIAPVVNKINVYQPNDSALIDVTNTNLTSNMQYIVFNISDLGSPNSGINKSTAIIQLRINSTTLTLTINNGTLLVSNSQLQSNFSLSSFDDNQIIIAWNSSNLEVYGFEKTYDEQYINVEWELISLNDNFGNSIVSGPSNVMKYVIDIDALPPPPDLLAEIINIGIIFSLFIVAGVGAAFVYEKIRYLG